MSIIQNLFGEDFAKVYSSILSGNLKDSIKNINREQRRSSKVRAEERALKEKLNSDLKMFEDVIGMINLISKILPSDKYIVYKDILIPLDKKYLREDYISLRYKYSSKSTIVGHITGDLKGVMDFKPNNELDEIFKALDDLLLASLQILSIKEDFKVMHPIAWYFS